MVSPIRYYIGVNGTAYRKLAHAVEVTLLRAEGPTELCDKKPRVFTGRDAMQQANRQLRTNAFTAPKNGGYDKHDFTVTFSNGEKYSGRYDLKHASHGIADLRQHMREFLQYMASDETAAKYRAAWRSNPDAQSNKMQRDAQAFLRRCDVGQYAVAIPEKWLTRAARTPRRALVLVRDFRSEPLKEGEQF